MEINANKAGKGYTPVKRKFDVPLRPVLPYESGTGLPYAPVDWPNPGDIWSWRVGKRTKSNGFYNDRFLYAPESLQMRPTKKLQFGSKPSVERYLQSAFPEADINAFFASFNWDIPSKSLSNKKGKFSSAKSCPSPNDKFIPSAQSLPPLEKKSKMERGDGIFTRTRKVAVRRTSQISTLDCVKEFSVDTLAEEGTLASGAASEDLWDTTLGRGQVSKSHATVAPGESVCTSPINCKVEPINPLEESRVGLTPEEFDTYINSLDEILILPFPSYQTASKGEGFTEARKKLSSLLAMGFHSLVSSNKLNELIALTAKLQNDPSLSSKELSMLRLIQEIPLISKCFLETREVSVQADRFFADLDTNIASVTSLRNEYSTSKEEIEVLQAEEASTLLNILDIDQQIAKLQSKKQELTQAIKVTNKKIVHFTSMQKRVMDSLPKIVQEVQVANSKKPEWELKKKRSAEQEAEILAKFAPLEGFYF